MLREQENLPYGRNVYLWETAICHEQVQQKCQMKPEQLRTLLGLQGCCNIACVQQQSTC